MMTLRTELGDFSSIICLKSIISGMEDALGEKATAIALIAAGRARGKSLAAALDLTHRNHSLDQLTALVAEALGEKGTRLLILDRIEPTDDGFSVYTRETVCSAGEALGSQRCCTFTLGVIQGVLEAITGQRYHGRHVESVLRGAGADVFEYQARS